MKQIHSFATKWLNKFLDAKTNYIELVDHYMADDCRALSFTMDMGSSFKNKYKVAAGLTSSLYNVIDQVTDISVLGNAIYSRWRYFNHWAYDAKEIMEPENREWFIIALLRLGELSIRQNNCQPQESQIEPDMSQAHAPKVNHTIELKCQDSKTNPQCNDIGARIINKAAEQGIGAALYLLGEIHEYGILAEKNPEIAFGYYYQSAQRKHEEAYLKVAEGYRTGHGIQKDEDVAVYWYIQAAWAGKAEGQFRCGIALENGIGIMADAQEALSCYLLAAAQNHAGAQYNAAICYHYGKGTEVDMDKALHYYRLSAEGGHSAAQFNLGVCCADGIGMSPNPAEAVRWYTKAAEAGYYKAQVNLAYCYQHGIGVPADIDTALYWYDMAEKQGE